MGRPAAALPRRSSWFFWGLVVGLAVVVSSCGSEEPRVVRLGVLADFASSEGRPFTEAAELAVAQLEAAGGLTLDGQPVRIELVREDSHGAPVPAMEGARRLIQQGVVAIIGPGRSSDAIAVANVTENARIPMVNPVSTHPETTADKRYSFRVCFTDTLQGKVLGRFAAEDLGLSTAAVLFDDASAYNRGLAHTFRQSFEAMGGSVVAFESYATGEHDVSAQLTAIAEVGPQVLFLPNYLEEIPGQARQARQFGVEAPMLGGDSWASIAFDQVPELEGSYFSLHWHPDELTEQSAAQAVIQAYRRAHGVTPAQRAVLAYDAVALLLEVIAQVGDDPEAIRDRLAETEDFAGVTGALTFRGQGGDPMKRVLVAQVSEGASRLFQVVEPDRDIPDEGS